MKNLFESMEGKRCLSYVPLKQPMRCQYIKIAEQDESLLAEESSAMQSIGEIFERMFRDARTITLEEYLGFPKFKPVESIPINEIGKEADQIVEFLRQRNIRIGYACQYSDHDRYTFYTIDLMQQEVFDVSLKGVYCTFIYELIRPNTQFEIETLIEDFLVNLFSHDWRFFNFCITNDFTFEGTLFSGNHKRAIRIEFENRLAGWKVESYSAKIEHFQEARTAVACIDLQLSMSETNITKTIEKVRLGLAFIEDSWRITSLTDFYK